MEFLEAVMAVMNYSAVIATTVACCGWNRALFVIYQIRYDVLLLLGLSTCCLWDLKAVIIYKV